MSDFNFSLPLPRNEALPATIADHTRRDYDRMARSNPSTYLFHSKATSGARSFTDRGWDASSRSGHGLREMFRRLVEVQRSGLTLGLSSGRKWRRRTQELIRTEFPAADAHARRSI